MRCAAGCVLLVTFACGGPTGPQRWPGESARRDAAEHRAERDVKSAWLIQASRDEATRPLSEKRRAKAVRELDGYPAHELGRLVPRLAKGSDIASAAALRAAKWKWHIGDGKGALKALDTVPSSSAFFDLAEALRSRVNAGVSPDPARLAVLLPLSGKYGSLGRSVRPAIEMAMPKSVSLVFLDTEGSADRAAELVDVAYEKERAVAILGPLGVKESRAAAQRATQLGLPIALLSPAGGRLPARGNVFRFLSTPAAEAQTAARAAVDAGFRSVAVFAPRDDRGRLQAAAFSAEARRSGALVVKEEFYDPSASDLEPPVKRLLGLDPKTNARLRRHLRSHGRKEGWKSFSPDIFFDLVYIPDGYQNGALIASYLPFFNVELRKGEIVDTVALRRKHGGRLPSVVQLMGSSGWHHDALFPRGGVSVEGALVVDYYAGGPAEEHCSDKAQKFFERYERRRKHPPSALARQTYDGATVLASALEELAEYRGAENPRNVLRRLLRTTAQKGLCGQLSVTERGELSRAGLVLRAEAGGFGLFAY